MAVKLRRTIGLPQLILYGVSSMVGAGIYSVIGVAAGMAGTHLWLSFILAAIAAFIAVLSYTELSARFPKTGAEYQYLKKAFPELKALAFLGGYLVILNAATTAATVSVAFGGYLNHFMEMPIPAVAFGLLLVCTLINIVGIRESTWASTIMAMLEVGGLFLLIGIGLNSVLGTGLSTPTFDTLPKLSDMNGVFSATALIFFVYIGFEAIVDLSEETREPKRIVPLALLISVIFTAVIYILVAFSVLAISTPAQLSASTSPLTTAVESAAPWAGPVLAIAALFATASTALISMVGVSRVLYGMARDGEMPSVLAKLLPKQQTPWAAALTLFFISCLFLPLGEVKILASVSSLGVLLLFVAVQAAVIRLRFTNPEVSGTFYIPFAIGKVPVIPVIGIVICIGLMTLYEPLVYAITAAVILAGGVVFVLHNHYSRPTA